MSTELILAGAGGFARETVELVRAVNAADDRWDLLGLVDDSSGLAGTDVAGCRVLGSLQLLGERPEASVVLCIANPGSPDVRSRIESRLALDPERYAVLVHPSAVVAGSVTLGAGTVVHATVVMTADVAVGRHVAIMPAVVLTHDVVVGDHVTFGSGVLVSGGVRIGGSAYIGAGSVIREGLRVGSGAVVGAGAVVTRAVPDGEVWVGNPARFLRTV